MTGEAISDSSTRVFLDEARCIELSGDDARAFAQAQFSGDVRALRPLHWQWNAWLDHKGGVRALIHLADAGDGRLLALLRGGGVQTVCTELRKYVLRAKVRIEPLRDCFLSIGAPLPLHELRVGHEAIGFGCGDRSIWLETAQRASDAGHQRDFHLAEIREGWPTLPPGLEAKFLPPALGLEHLRAVSFDKGCYPGQEIAARLHYRGGHKRRLAHVIAPAPLRPGGPLAVGNGEWGIVLNAVETSVGGEALAVLEKTCLSSHLHHDLKVIRSFEA